MTEGKPLDLPMAAVAAGFKFLLKHRYWAEGVLVTCFFRHPVVREDAHARGRTRARALMKDKRELWQRQRSLRRSRSALPSQMALAAKLTPLQFSSQFALHYVPGRRRNFPPRAPFFAQVRWKRRKSREINMSPLRASRIRMLKVPRRSTGANDNTSMPINWWRGLFRIWLLLSMAWVLGWSVYLALYAIQGGFDHGAPLFDLPVLLLGPPIALLAFGSAAIWALRGFKPGGQLF